MHDNIEHPGIIEKIDNNRIWVSIQSHSACGSCHSKSYCGMAEVAEKIVEVNTVLPGHSYQTGQNVTIHLKQSSGYRALFMGYILPFLLVLMTLITTLSISGNEALSALLALFITIPYYGFLYVKRDTIKASFRFFIKA
jgi:sigma-E factor negative regulatory protein RseC